MARPKRIALPLLAMASLLALALSRGMPDAPLTSATSTPRRAGELVAADVVEVIDGDTVRVSIRGESEKVRFIGVDTPESTKRHEPYGEEAASYTRRTLEGTEVWLQCDVGERDRYGRLLAYVWQERPVSESASEVRAKMFNARLLLDGQAQVMTVPPNVRYADLFVVLQREARASSRGLWGGAAR